MSNGAVALLVGAVFLLIAIIGGNFSVHGGTTLPKITRVSRAGLGVLGLVLLALGAYLVIPDHGTPPPSNGVQASGAPVAGGPTSGGPSVPNRQPGSSSPADVKFTSPTEGVKIDYGKDVTVTISVSGLQPDQAIWLFTAAEADPASLYFTGTDPLAVSNGSHTHVDQDVGDSTDSGQKLSYVTYQVDTACSAALKQIADGPGDPPTVTLPNPCLGAEQARVDMNVR